MKRFGLLVLCGFLASCGAMEGVGDNFASLFKTSSQYRKEMAARFNQWLGKHKDERIRTKGPPDKCATLSSGEEACEWSQRGVSGG